MNKYYGQIGFSTTVSNVPGVWDEEIVERSYYGDINRNFNRFSNTDKVNGDINISNVISVVADPYAYENFNHMKYITFMNNKWKINSVEVQFPRLIIEVGGLYNG